MLKGIYTAASGMMSNMIASDTLANNLANVSTVGYKRNSVNFQAFPEMLIQRFNQNNAGQENSPVGSLMTGSKVHSTAIYFNQGQLQETHNPFDMALDGKGFFTVKDKTGRNLYSRNGEFTISSDNLLVDKNGNPVQGELGNIVLPPNAANVDISTNGTITANGQVLDKLVITEFKNENSLEKAGDNYFTESDQTQILPRSTGTDPANYHVRQGMLELSNCNPVLELVKTLEGLRIYEALQKNIQTHNQTLQKAVTEVGSYK